MTATARSRGPARSGGWRRRFSPHGALAIPRAHPTEMKTPIHAEACWVLSGSGSPRTGKTAGRRMTNRCIREVTRSRHQEEAAAQLQTVGGCPCIFGGKDTDPRGSVTLFLMFWKRQELGEGKWTSGCQRSGVGGSLTGQGHSMRATSRAPVLGGGDPVMTWVGDPAACLSQDHRTEYQCEFYCL